MNKDMNNSDRTNTLSNTATQVPDLICLSHLRWDFVYQRPQHLLSRFAKERRVFFVEEPMFDEGEARLDVSQRDCGVTVVVPRLTHGLDTEACEAAQQELLDRLFAEQEIEDHVLWYYTPMAMRWTRHLEPLAVVYDCMDELSAFKGAPPSLGRREAELFSRADLVFTGGQSLYEAKRDQHRNVFAFPSSIDAPHFAQARSLSGDPADQASIPHPRLGFFGVIDERMNLALLDEMAAARPGWHLVMIGPVVKIDPAELPQRDNIHYLGGKSYGELPAYLAGWDVALMPFALNESTRFISPTKTPEYLAAGRPVVSTSIRDVVRPYGESGMVHIADTAAEFVAACEAALDDNSAARMGEIDAFLAQTSWDRTWGRMRELIEDVVSARRAQAATPTQTPAVVPAVRAARAAAVGAFMTGD
ncbi:MAG TPA: glycosyltransferase family 1 protein [Pyrinomonadaceae bacterium]|jgi:UDP-galactopyranose mutase|nr:glycosyltransferase family 1 protein [Pyrinomonadaceae bacterium]